MKRKKNTKRKFFQKLCRKHLLYVVFVIYLQHKRKENKANDLFVSIKNET